VSESPENQRFRLPHCRLTPPLQGTLTKIRISLTLPETRVIGLHLRRWQYGSIFIQIFVVGSERRVCFETECIMALQGRRSQWSSGRPNMPDCDVTGPRFESHRGQLQVSRKNHYDIQLWAWTAYPYCSAYRSTQPSTHARDGKWVSVYGLSNNNKWWW